MKNATRTELENLEHDIMSMMTASMERILDNGDRPDKRISGIVGLYEAMKTTMAKVERVTLTIPEAP
jgi:hypothetical protein